VTSRDTAGILPAFSTLLLLLAVSLAAAGEPPGRDALEVRLSHDTMKMKVGFPAIIVPGGAYPSVQVVSHHDETGSLDGEIIREDDGAAVNKIASQTLRREQQATIQFEGKPDADRYRLQLQFVVGDHLVSKDAYYFSVLDPDGLPENYSLIVHPGKDGKLVYIPDYRGNRIPDFSMVGYMSGEKEVPDVPVKATLAPEPGDDTARIQQAIDEVSTLAPDNHGFRGAVLLKKGVYEIGTLKIKGDGVVVRGKGPGKDRKTLRLDPAAAPSREALVRSLSKQDGTFLITGRLAFNAAGSGGVEIAQEPAGEILDAYVPVGAMTFSIRNPGDFRVGDKVFIQRRGNEAWIRAIGMDRIPGEQPWQPRDWSFERIITAIKGNRIAIDAPIVTAIEKRWGGGRVYRYDDPGRISRVGIENIRMIQYCIPEDQYCIPEEKYGLGKFRGTAIALANVKHAWVRDVVPESTLDNHPYTYWMTDRRNEWIQYDLQQPQKVSALKMSFPTFSPYVDAKKRDQSPAEQDRVYFFDIAVSEDGRNWRIVYEGGKGPADGHDVFHPYEFAEVEARYVRVIAKGSNVGKSGRKSSTVFHMSRVFIMPEPRFEPVEPVPEVRPASLYRQQVKERYQRQRHARDRL